MALKLTKIGNINWVNIVDPRDADINYLEENFQFHNLDILDVLGEKQPPKIDVYKHYMFSILYFPEIINKKLNNLELNVFIGQNYLITIQKKKIGIIQNLFSRISKSENYKNKLSSRGSGYLLYKVLDPLFKTYYSESLKSLNQFVTSVEEEIYDKRTDKGTIEELTYARRIVLDIRRTVSMEKFIIDSLSRSKKDFIVRREYVVYFDDIRDYLEKVWTILDDYKNITDGLFETNESLLSLRTNEIIKLLTLISVSLMPLTLLSGVYGMNVDDLPFVHNAGVVGLIFGSLLAVIITVVLIYRKKGSL
jgi:magnesium transporter